MFQYVLNMNVWDAYISVQEIGAGTYGKMHKVQNKLNQQFFAAKVIQLANDSPEHKKVIFEIQNLQQKYQHPNLIQVYEVFQWQEKKQPIQQQKVLINFALIVEYCETNLEKLQYYEQQKSVKLYPRISQVVCLLQQAVQALSWLAQQGIYHKDIRPNNLLMKDNQLKIKCEDYGISDKVFKENLKQQAIIAQSEYLAPELTQVYLQGIDFPDQQREKADIFSLGMSFFVLATNKSQIELKELNLQNNVVMISQLIDTEINDEQQKFKTILKKMLRINPEERYQTFESIQKDLDQYQYEEAAKSLDKRIRKPLFYVTMCLGLFILGLMLFLLGLWTANTVQSSGSQPIINSKAQFQQFPQQFNSCNTVFSKKQCYIFLTIEDWQIDQQFKTALQKSVDYIEMIDMLNKYQKGNGYWSCMKNVIEICRTLPMDFPPPFQCINEQYLQRKCNDIMTSLDYTNDQQLRKDVINYSYKDYAQIYNKALQYSDFGVSKTNYFSCLEKSINQCDVCNFFAGESYTPKAFQFEDLNEIFSSLACSNFIVTEQQKKFDCTIRNYEQEHPDCFILGKFIDDNPFFFNSNDKYVQCLKRVILSCKTE